MNSSPLPRPALLLALLLATTPSFAAIHVIDAAGVPIADAPVLVLIDGKLSTWVPFVTDAEGRIDTDTLTEWFFDGGATKVSVIATAAGHAWTTQHLGEFAKRGDVAGTVTIPRGREVTVRLLAPDGRPIPDGVAPFLFNADHMGHIWWQQPTLGEDTITPRFTTLSIPEAKGDGTFVFRIREDEDSIVHIGLNDPQYLLGWYSEEQITSETIELTFDLPLPGSSRHTLEVAEGSSAGEMTAQLTATIAIPDHEGRVVATLATMSGEFPLGGEFTFGNIAPGAYQGSLFAGTPLTQWSLPAEKQFRDRKEVTIESDKMAQVVTRFANFDTDTLRGDTTAIVTLTRLDGSPAANIGWYLVAHTQALSRPVNFASGFTDAQGIARLENLKPGLRTHSYALQTMSGDTIGHLEMEEQRDHYEFTMSMPPVQGDLAPDIALVDMDTGKTVRLSDYHGQVIFLDFWATWCGPCQDPMQKNSDLLKRRANDWAGKAVILAISCDDDIQTLKDHIAEKGWGNITNLWCEEGGTGWNATAMRTYAINGVPTAFLIDTKGRITWRGHPSGEPLEQRIDEMIKASGKQISMR